MKRLFIVPIIGMILLFTACSNTTNASENLFTNINTTEEQTTYLTLPVLMPDDIPGYINMPTYTYETSTRYFLGLEWTCYDDLGGCSYEENNKIYLTLDIANEKYYLHIPYDETTESVGFVLVYIESDFHVLGQFGNYSSEIISYSDGVVSYGEQSFVLSVTQQLIFENYYYLFS